MRVVNVTVLVAEGVRFLCFLKKKVDFCMSLRYNNIYVENTRFLKEVGA